MWVGNWCLGVCGLVTGVCVCLCVFCNCCVGVCGFVTGVLVCVCVGNWCCFFGLVTVVLVFVGW